MASEATGWADKVEIDTFDEFVERFRAGELGADEFRRFRLQQGVYGQRQADVHMVRVKIPAGRLTAPQLERLADVAAETPRGVGHVTTRQNVQFHFVPLDRVADHLRALADVGLTTREACGNTIRNVTVGHCAGICPGEVFDPTPYAELVARFFLRNPLNQNLPRKFKIAFSGCPDDTGLSWIHDFGAKAAVRTRDGRAERGFEVVIAGGLGPAPRLAEPLEDFTPATDLLPTLAAVVRIFDRLGNRENRNLARLKFVARDLGMPELRARIVREREALRLALAGTLPEVALLDEVPAPPLLSLAAPSPADPAYRRWRATNVADQKQAGFAAVHVRLVLGDVTAEQLRVLAQAAREFADGEVRTTNQQNVHLRWIRASALPALHALLAPAGLARPGGEQAVDVTACAGADTCQLGITSSRGLARALGAMLERDFADLGPGDGVRIKISGCPNSCGQHHLGGIGFFGGAKKFHGEQAPTYQMLIGGTTGGPDPRFAAPVARVPAKQIPGAVRALLVYYRAHRSGAETFPAFAGRVGPEPLRAVLAPWTEIGSPADAPDAYLDWGSGARFTTETGPGECAA